MRRHVLGGRSQRISKDKQTSPASKCPMLGFLEPIVPARLGSGYRGGSGLGDTARVKGVVADVCLPGASVMRTPCWGSCKSCSPVRGHALSSGPVRARCTGSRTLQLPACSQSDLPSDPCSCLVTICSPQNTVWLSSFPTGDLLSV